MSLKTDLAQILSCCPKNLSCPKWGGGGCYSPPCPPVRTPMSLWVTKAMFVKSDMSQILPISSFSLQVGRFLVRHVFVPSFWVSEVQSFRMRLLLSCVSRWSDLKCCTWILLLTGGKWRRANWYCTKRTAPDLLPLRNFFFLNFSGFIEALCFC